MNLYAYGFPAVVVKDTLDAIQRICQLHYPRGNPPGWQEGLADLALNMAARANRYPVDMVIRIMVDIDTAIEAPQTIRIMPVGMFRDIPSHGNQNELHGAMQPKTVAPVELPCTQP